ncbi:3,4-dihydroxy-2-butanone-4-phosphate synthase [Ancylostoma ceylanicum]|uniref:3,4-dihydroxy-2-butanone-4-phosphate synthase n=1 Tax=Ancylostoma ceylanicum TaxID=53326 RepID=A0A0D6L4J0_9BILA|nr:3,4-dihydroxy-2-butanone-4-phosphate synthase [Ancylostoma ceylanicum]
MVETLNNRLQEDENFVENIGLVIVDEAHYNSFRKIFQFYQGGNILGVTATPLSSNRVLPLNDNYNKLLVGESIASLIEGQYLANAETYTYDVNLHGLKIGTNGDFTVSSSDVVYGNYFMQEKLLFAYEEIAVGTKTLIFNPGIETSVRVEETFKKRGFKIRHLDSTFSDKDRKEVLQWFKETKDAILSSVGILTTGFDEPTVETIILNRATRSLTLYHQMIGRGSRKLPKKDIFKVIDLGNNVRRFGLWQDYINWQDAFRFPDRFLESRLSESDDIEFEVEFEFPKKLVDLIDIKALDDFNMKDVYYDCLDSEEAIEDIKKGKVVIVVDDEDRENEGDFIAAAECVTPEMINFMATHGRGLICAPLTAERCDELGLVQMVTNNTVLHETQFTVSVDLIGHGCTTGISVQDRAKTIKALINPDTKPSDLGRPGHIFPLRAKDGGVLRRTGHTEAAVDLARLAGFAPAGILVEILNEDGTMARLPQLIEVAKKFDLKLISIEQLIEYRMHNESLIERILKGISLEVNDSEIVSIVGSSGAALENVCIPAMMNGQSMGDAKKLAAPLLDRLGLAHRSEHKPNELSGGEQQRVAVARALINRPSIIFADEPSGNLDTENSTLLHNLFFELREEFRQTFVIVTHNENLAKMADRMITMKDGMIVE